MRESLLSTLKRLASESQGLRGQESVYDNMFNTIFPQAMEIEGDFLEVGVFLGKTTIFLSKYLELVGSDKKLISIDPLTPQHNNCRNTGDLDIRKHFCEHTKDLVNHTHHFLTSFEGAKLIKDGSICFAFIDGDHTWKGVVADFAAYLPKIALNGIMCFDDYENEYWEGVGKAVREVVYPNRNLEVVFEGRKEVYFRKISE